MFKKILLVSLPISLQFVYSAGIFPYSVSWLWAVLLAMSVLLLLLWLYRHNSANQKKIEANITADILNSASISKSIISENKMLNSTESLIEFLKLKSKKLKINNDKFNINNVLNEVSGSLSSDFPNSDIELIFSIDKDVPKFLTGDSLHLGQILISLLKDAIENGANGELRLEISKFKSVMSNQEIEFKIIDSNARLEEGKQDRFKTPHYNVKKGMYEGLEPFVANELISLMGSKLLIKYSEKEGTIFTFTLPFEASDWTERRRYRLSNVDMTNKKVLLIDNNYSSALAIKKMISYFKHEVTIVKKEDFNEEKSNFALYDILMLSEDFFESYINHHIKVAKKTSDLMVVCTSNMFSSKKFEIEDGIIDKRINKPFSQEQIFEMITDLYEENKEQANFVNIGLDNTLNMTTETNDSEIIVNTEPFKEKENISPDDFADFSNYNLLIVEDNIINQKILTSVLARAKMHIFIASNGKEAVDMVCDSNNKFDFVLMDINMPVMDGYIATSIIRSDERFVNLPIIALTALILDSEINKMFKYGVNGYLAKPLKTGKLYSAFEYFLEKNIVAIENIADKNKLNIEDLYGIDIQKGIAFADGNDTLYREVLAEFLVAYGGTDILLRNLVDDQKYDKIRLLSYDMCSLTKTIGAYKMNEIVDKIHKLFLYNSKHMIPKYAEEYGRELSRLRASINQYLDNVS